MNVLIYLRLLTHKSESSELAWMTVSCIASIRLSAKYYATRSPVERLAQNINQSLYCIICTVWNQGNYGEINVSKRYKIIVCGNTYLLVVVNVEDRLTRGPIWQEFNDGGFSR